MSKRIIKDYKAETKYIIDWIKDYFCRNGNMETKAIIGISGGKDSTIVAYLCAAALGWYRVVGVKMPQGEQYDIDMADRVFKELNIDEYHINIENIVNAFANELEIAQINTNNPVVGTNIPPRVRMTILYAVAAHCGGRVANTSNLSERTVGWSTKWGDGVGDFAPLADYTVEEVLHIGEELGIPADLLYKTPEDGLTGKSDEDNLGVSYEQIDQYIRSDEHPQPYEAYKIIKDKERAASHKWITLPHPHARIKWDDKNLEDYYF